MGLKLPKAMLLRNASDAQLLPEEPAGHQETVFSSDALIGHGKLDQRQENLPGQIASQSKQGKQDQFLFCVEALLPPIPQRNDDALPEWHHDIFPQSKYRHKDHYNLCAPIEVLSQSVIVPVAGVLAVGSADDGSFSNSFLHYIGITE